MTCCEHHLLHAARAPRKPLGFDERGLTVKNRGRLFWRGDDLGIVVVRDSLVS